ncbi:hypothetical protein ABZ639_26890 [Saccharomonospora sp. NPDC006951]
MRSRRTVLAIVHNITAATRLLDVLPLLGHDDRIQIFFTIPGSSAFTDGTDRFLAEHGIRVYEPEALGDDPKIDLVISASFGDELGFRPAPKVVLPHGVGYNKYLNRKTGTGNVFGLSAEWLYDKHGDLVADLLVLSHEEQLDQLRRACPDATDTALVAADLVVSDHGSLTCYATALNKPVLIAADGGGEVVDDSPLAQLLDLLPRLEPGTPLLGQVEETIAKGAIGRDFPGRMFANQGRAAAILRSLMYDILRLPESPGSATARPLPAPAATIAEPPAFDVVSRHRDAGDGLDLTFERYPSGPATPPDADHVAASEIAPDPGLIERAAVIWSADPHDDLPSALSWTAETLARYPGARVAVTETAGTAIARLRNGETVTCHGGLSRSVAGSAIHRWSLTASRPGTVRVNVGAAPATLTITT